MDAVVGKSEGSDEEKKFTSEESAECKRLSDRFS